jgi:hypothetical protein
MGTTAGVLFALGASRGVALNFSLASGLLLLSAALTAAAMGLGGSLVLTLRARRASRTFGMRDAQETVRTAPCCPQGSPSRGRTRVRRASGRLRETRDRVTASCVSQRRASAAFKKARLVCETRLRPAAAPARS